jgi:hypothetical protein
MFHKFLRVEAFDLGVATKMRSEYDSIFDSLTGWLNDEMETIIPPMEKDTAAVLRSWEAVRVSGTKIAGTTDELRFKKGKAFAKFDEIQKKWG